MAEELLARPILFLDGGLGTTLEEEHGVHFSSATPLWSSHPLISSPDVLLETQTDFARAGADILLTATYQASFDGFNRTPREPQHKGREDDGRTGYSRAEATEYMRSAVSISRSAFHEAGKPAGLVALSLGAYGATMVPSQEYTGKYPAGLMDSHGLYHFHLDRITCFVEDEKTWNNIDLVAFETLPRLAEVQADKERVKEFWISCVFPDDDELPDGSSISEVVTAMLSDDFEGKADRVYNGSNENSNNDNFGARPFAIGINCTKVHKLNELIQTFEATSKERSLALPHLVIYPDGALGLIYDTVTQTWVAATETSDGEDKDASRRKGWHEELADIVREVHGRGAWKGILVGGCCKTTPAHIAKLRQSLE